MLMTNISIEPEAAKEWSVCEIQTIHFLKTKVNTSETAWQK